MPRQRSQHLLIRIKMNRPQLPAGLVVRHRLLERLDEALQRGAVGFLQKPFSQHSLLDLVKEQVEGEDEF